MISPLLKRYYEEAGIIAEGNNALYYRTPHNTYNVFDKSRRQFHQTEEFATIDEAKAVYEEIENE